MRRSDVGGGCDCHADDCKDQRNFERAHRDNIYGNIRLLSLAVKKNTKNRTWYREVVAKTSRERVVS